MGVDVMRYKIPESGLLSRRLKDEYGGDSYQTYFTKDFEAIKPFLKSGVTSVKIVEEIDFDRYDFDWNDGCSWSCVENDMWLQGPDGTLYYGDTLYKKPCSTIICMNLDVDKYEVEYGRSPFRDMKDAEECQKIYDMLENEQQWFSSIHNDTVAYLQKHCCEHCGPNIFRPLEDDELLEVNW